MDRVNGVSDTYESAMDPAIFGLRFAVNPVKTLKPFSVAKNDASASVLIVLGGALSHATIAGSAVLGGSENEGTVLEPRQWMHAGILRAAGRGPCARKVRPRQT